MSAVSDSDRLSATLRAQQEARRAADQQWIEEAVRSIQAGVDVEDNYRRLFDRFYRPLCSFFSKRVRSGDAEQSVQDLVQRTWVQVHRGIDGFSGRSQFSTWLFRVAFNTFVSWHRGERARGRPGEEKMVVVADTPTEDVPTRPLELVSDRPSPLDEAIDEELVGRLHAAIEELPPKMRRCLVLRIRHDLKYGEIASQLSLSVGTVKAHVSQAKNKLQQMLEGET